MVKVLVMDDDPELLDMVALMLRSNGMSPTCLYDGQELLPFLEKNNADIILMDIYLGEEDGRELCCQVKTDDRFRHIPVVLYSAGNVSRDSVEKAMADDFIKKPFDMKVLVDRIHKLVHV